MSDEDSTPSGHGRNCVKHTLSGIVHIYRRRWFQVVTAGIFFITLMEVSYLLYPNSNLVPAIILYAAFTVPVAFIVHLDERLESMDLPVGVIVVLFISAGAVGVAFASTIESAFFPSLGFFRFLAVGPVEETAKMVVPLIAFALGTYRSVGAGVMIGLTSAMAFSALETAGYGFNAFLGNLDGDGTGRVADLFENPSNVLLLDANIAFRSLVDPIGHGTWTMLICYVLLDEARKAGRFVLNGRVILAVVLAMFLHSSWDTTLSVPGSPLPGKVLATIGFFVTAGFTVWLMVRLIHRTREVMETDTPAPRS